MPNKCLNTSATSSEAEPHPVNIVTTSSSGAVSTQFTAVSVPDSVSLHFSKPPPHPSPSSVLDSLSPCSPKISHPSPPSCLSSTHLPSPQLPLPTSSTRYPSPNLGDVTPAEVRQPASSSGGCGDAIKFASLNVNGLKVASKRRSIFGKRRDRGVDICMLQETHSVPDDEHIWRREWGGSRLL